MAFYYKEDGRMFLVRFVCRYRGLNTYAVEREYYHARVVLNDTDVESIDSSTGIPDSVVIRAVSAFLANERREFIAWCSTQSPAVDPIAYPPHPMALESVSA